MATAQNVSRYLHANGVPTTNPRVTRREGVKVRGGRMRTGEAWITIDIEAPSARHRMLEATVELLEKSPWSFEVKHHGENSWGGWVAITITKRVDV